MAKGEDDGDIMVVACWNDEEPHSLKVSVEKHECSTNRIR